MKNSKGLSEKEIVKETLLSNQAPYPCVICPYKEKVDYCKHGCYKFFTRWERFRFIINLKCCPCGVLPVEKVVKRTWDWISSRDDDICESDAENCKE